MNDAYRQHLSTVHERWNTPEDILLDAVREVTRAPVVARTRITHGEANEVYDYRFDGAPSLIVRVGRDAVKTMEQERWVIAQCETHGVRAPHIYTITHLELDGAPLHICVMEKIDGERLLDASLSQNEIEHVLHELGDWMSQLNAIPVDGFGYVDGAGKCEAKTYDGTVDWFLTLLPEFEAAGAAAGLDVTTLSGWIRFIEGVMRAVRPTPVLAHNDLSARHVLVKDGRLAGVIDFGEVSGEPALNEFAKWDFMEGARFPVRFLRAGYRNQAIFAPEHAPFYRALWLLNGLFLLRWYHISGYVAGLAEVKAKLLAGQASA